MIDLGIIEKVKKLKVLYPWNDPEVSREAVDQIEAWEKRLQELSLLDDYANLSTTKEIVAVVKERLKGVLLKKVAKGNTSDDMRILDAREDELRFLLGRVLPPFEAEVQQIESLIDAELQP